jgi:hypothetical protein
MQLSASEGGLLSLEMLLWGQTEYSFRQLVKNVFHKMCTQISDLESGSFQFINQQTSWTVDVPQNCPRKFLRSFRLLLARNTTEEVENKKAYTLINIQGRD